MNKDEASIFKALGLLLIIIIGFIAAISFAIYLTNLKYDKSCLDKIGKDYCKYYTDVRDEIWEYQSPVIYDLGFVCVQHRGSERTGLYSLSWNYYFTQDELKRCKKVK